MAAKLAAMMCAVAHPDTVAQESMVKMRFLWSISEKLWYDFLSSQIGVRTENHLPDNTRYHRFAHTQRSLFLTFGIPYGRV